MKIAKRYELVPLDKIVPYARNSRVHPKDQIAQIRASFREFGVLSPCLVDENYNLIAGHGRLGAAKAEGLSEINCVIVEGLTEAQRKAFTITDNKLTDNSAWNDELLALEFADLKDMGFDLELTGFDPAEIEALFAGGNGQVKDDDFDLSAALEEAAFVLPGDIWTIGRHRLMCGDATKQDDVERLMDGKKANLVLTDPPYNAAFQSSSGLTIKNDKMKSEEFYAFLLASFQNLAEALANHGSVYIFHSDTEGENFRRAFREAGFHLSGTCIWSKNAPVLGRSPFLWVHEPILFGWKKSGKHQWYKGRSEKTVWHFDKPTKNQHHPTSKPLDLLAYPIQCSTQANGIVLDTFGGSGSTLIACEQTDRICYMLELDPKYASVICRRYAEFAGNNGEGITCIRDGEILQYIDLVKEVKSC